MNNGKAAYNRLVACGIRPSLQRIAILDYLMAHPVHPSVEDVYLGLCQQMPSLSRTTVYNTLRMLSEKKAAQMLTIDDHRVCYDGNTRPHVHFLCRKCGRVFDLMDETAPMMDTPACIGGHLVDEMQLYYKGICATCASNSETPEE